MVPNSSCCNRTSHAEGEYVTMCYIDLQLLKISFNFSKVPTIASKGDYGKAIHKVEKEHDTYLDVDFKRKWSEGFYSIHEKLMKRTHSLMRMANSELGQA